MADDIVQQLRSEHRMALAPIHMSDAAAEIERLRRWKAEATDVLGVWQRLGDAVVAVMDSDDTLGRRIPDIVADRLAALEAENERLRVAGNRLAAAVNAVATSGPREQMVELTVAYIDWQEARRG